MASKGRENTEEITLPNTVRTAPEDAHPKSGNLKTVEYSTTWSE